LDVAPNGLKQIIFILNLIRMKSKLYPALLLIAVFAITSCSKNSNPTPKPPTNPIKTDSIVTTPIWSSDADVYFVGTSEQGNKNAATYWKNGVATVLSSGDDATGIAISGNDIYVTGRSGGGAAYWKNGVLTSLKVSQSTTEAFAITTNGNDIYIAGDIDAKATYWKNGVATSVQPNQLLNSVANAIAVNGNDVYLAGYTISVAGVFQAAYWKNGILTQLSPAPLPGTSTQATGIAVSGTDVYVTGYTNDGATLWKNGVATVLSKPGVAVANSIIVNGSDTYVSGFSNAVVTYWKNGTAVNLSPGNIGNLIDASYVALDGNDIYVAGGLSASPEGSIYWRNGIPYLFSKGLNDIKGIIVVPH